MGGIRRAGDLVARAQLHKKMKLDDGKNYVAQKLGVDVTDLADEFKMKDVRQKNDIGVSIAIVGPAKGIAAKYRIAEIFDYKINAVERFFTHCKLK